MRSRVVRALRPLDAMAVENAVQPGTPDVEYIGGWIELKSLAAWPKREDTLVRVPHFNTLQRLWLSRRCGKGGKAWLLLRVGREWVMLAGDTAAAILGNSSRPQLIAASCNYWSSTPSDQELLTAFGDPRWLTTTTQSQ